MSRARTSTKAGERVGGRTKPRSWQRKTPQPPAPVVLPEPPAGELPPLSADFELEEASPAADPTPPMPAPLQPAVKSTRHSNNQPKTEDQQIKESFHDVMRRVLADPQYQEKFTKRLIEGKVAPNLEALVLQMVMGRPPDAKDAAPPEPVSVRIVHEFADDTKKA